MPSSSAVALPCQRSGGAQLRTYLCGLRNLLRVRDGLCVVPLVDALNPVAVEAGNGTLAGVEHEWDTEPLGVAVVEHGVHEASRVPGLCTVPQERPAVAAVPPLLNKE